MQQRLTKAMLTDTLQSSTITISIARANVIRLYSLSKQRGNWLNKTRSTRTYVVQVQDYVLRFDMTLVSDYMYSIITKVPLYLLSSQCCMYFPRTYDY